MCACVIKPQIKALCVHVLLNCKYMHRGGIAIFTERIKSVHGLSKNKFTFKRTLQCFFNYEWALIIYLMKIRVRIRDQECNHFMNERFRCSHMDKNNCCACFSLS